MHYVYQLYEILLLARGEKTIFQTFCVAIFTLTENINQKRA